MPWLRHLAVLFAFVAAFARPAPASAFTPASPESRVGGFEVAAQLLVGELAAASCEQHQGIGAAYDENASGYRFAAGGGARFIARTGGEILDVTRIRIPGPRNSPFGKVDYLLGNVGSVESVGKGGFFRGVLGFGEGNLGPALERHLIENFGTATIEGSRIRAVGTLVGPGGRSATVQSVWQVTPEGFVDLITAVPR